MMRNKFAKNAVLINLVSAAATEMHQLLLGIQAKFGHAYPSLELGVLIGNCNAFANV